MRSLIITNNILVKEKFSDREILFVDGSYRDVLVKVRDLCCVGHKLLTHPLSGSVKPNETPFKSAMVSKAKQSAADAESMLIMDKALLTYDKFPKLNVKWNEQILDDFRVVDLALISSAIYD